LQLSIVRTAAPRQPLVDLKGAWAVRPRGQSAALSGKTARNVNKPRVIRMLLGDSPVPW
jgi:hypothetical protein